MIGMLAAGRKDPPQSLQLLPQCNDRANAPKLRIVIHPLDHIEGTTDALAIQ